MLIFKKLWFKLSLSQWIIAVAMFVGLFVAAYLEIQTKIPIQVTKVDLPAYYQIKPKDLTSRNYSSKNVPSNVFKNSQDIVGRYTLTSIPKEKPLIQKQLSPRINPNQLVDKVAVGIPATPTMTLVGNLQAGDIVNITLVPAKSKVNSQKNSSLSTISFSKIMVLDVKSASPKNKLTTSVIIIALPKNRQSEFATQIPDATLLISRDLGCCLSK